MKMKKLSMMKVFGLPHIHENTSILFNDTGIMMASGVNITADVAFGLTYHNHDFKGKVIKGEVMRIYRRFQQINGSFINKNTIMNVQKELLKLAQEDVNIVKKTLKN